MKLSNIILITLLFLLNCTKSASENYDSNLKKINSFGNKENGLPLGGPWYMISDSSSIYVSDIAHSSIFKYDFNGDHISNFGTPGKPGVGPGELANQTTIDVDENWLYVFDDSNLRLTLFDLFNGTSKVILNKHSLIEFAVQDSTIFAFSPKALAEPINNNENKLINTFTLDGAPTQSFGDFLNFTDGMFAGLSLPDIEIDDDYIYVLFRYFPLIRIYSLNGELLLQADISVPTQSDLITSNLDGSNFVKKQNYAFNFVNRGLFVENERLFVARQERFIAIDEYKFSGDSLLFETTHSYHSNLTEDYFIIDFFYKSDTNSFFVLEKNNDFVVTEYVLIE